MRNLFHNLTNIYACNNNILLKATKLRELIMGVTDLENHIQRYRGAAHEGRYVVISLHASTNGWNWQQLGVEHVASKEKKDGLRS